MKKRKILTLFLASLSFSGLISSCNKPSTPDYPIEEPQKQTIELTKDDAILLNDVLPETFEISDDTKASVENSKIAKVIGQKVFAINEGLTSVKLTNADTYYEFNVSVKSYETYENTETFITSASYGGYLIDASVGAAFIKGNTYDYTFSPSNATDGDKDYSIVVSNPDLLEFNEKDGMYSFTCKKVGNSIVKFVNSDGFTNAVFVIKIRVGYSNADEYRFGLQKFDYWGGYGFFDGYYQTDSTKITFLDDTSGVFSGKDGDKAFDPITFNYEVVEDEDNDPYTVIIKVTNFNNPQQTFGLSHIRFFKAGDQLMTYSGQGDNTRLNEIYYPKMNK